MAHSDFRRKAARRTINNKVLILCSGLTEKKYFDHIKRKYNDALVKITVEIEEHKRGNPIAIVDRAVAERDRYLEIWCVFDRDEFPDFDDAIKKADAYYNISCAFSNEAIEYWFLLHYENLTKALTRKQLNELLQRELGFPYKKDLNSIARLCRELDKCDLSKAEQRAQAGHERHIRDSGELYSYWCSCTTVYMLTKRLRKWG